MVRVAILFHRLGPYHHARCVAAGARCDLAVIELSAVDDTYAWAHVPGAPNFARRTLFEREDADRTSRRELAGRVHAALAEADPEVVAIPGWSHPGALAALLWCLEIGRAAVLMSESGKQDDVRRRAREATKRRVVRLFGSALVGGAPHAAYACALGLSRKAVFDGYDVVDNAHFERGARHARDGAARIRRSLGLPERFFLASSRFVAKKNLPASDLKSLVAWMKANPGEAKFINQNAAAQVTGILMEKATGTKVTYIPYRGAGPAMTDLISGQVDLLVVQGAAALPQVAARQMIVEAAHPKLGPVKLINHPLKFSRTPASIQGPPPSVGQDTRRVLRDMGGLDEATIDRLLAAGIALETDPATAPAIPH